MFGYILSSSLPPHPHPVESPDSLAGRTSAGPRGTVEQEDADWLLDWDWIHCHSEGISICEEKCPSTASSYGQNLQSRNPFSMY